MHMINDHVRNKYTADATLARGYTIYDEWIAKRYTSRKIVSYVELAAANAKQNKGIAASMEALACLFALDIRIKEKYNTILQCILSCFSWRRETRAFKLLKGSFNISDSYIDLRIAIEIELQKLREKLERGDVDDEDDTIRGGKRNGKAEEEPVVGEAKAQDQATNEKNEDVSKIEETRESAEEKTEKNPDAIQSEEQAEKITAQQNAEEAPSKDAQIAVQEDKEQAKEEVQEIKEENNSSVEKSDTSTDKSKETKTYNDAIDSPPLYEQSVDDKSQRDTKSFVDEVIIDNIVKGKEDAVRHNPLEDAKQIRETNCIENAVTQNREENKISDKNAYLYDKMVTSDKGAAKITEMKSTQVGASAQNINTAEKVQGAEDLRVPLQVDITLDQENEMRREISNSMSAEAIQAIYESQASAMREQLMIASAELGMDAPVEIIGIPETAPPEQSVAGPNRK